ncbi:MAG: site-specific integrase, partial [Lachnospiraceae bacterium]|nr:site-specific integrase [Lachnospiraceae bacterium]
MLDEELLERLKQDIRLRGHSQNTMDEYVHRISKFMIYSHRPLQELDEADVKSFLLYLIEERNLKKSSVNTYNSAIRFLYGVTLNRPLNVWQIPRCKSERELPQLLTQEEISRLFEHTPNPMYRALLMTIYGSGLRVSEAVGIKVCDIDSEKMRIFIRQGKGGQDRYATLSQTALNALRAYWKTCQPTDDLFLTRLKKRPTSRSVNNAFQASMVRAGITKNATVHTLRHCFATHLLEYDTNLFHIKKLLGHRSIRSTSWYLHYAE